MKAPRLPTKQLILLMLFVSFGQSLAMINGPVYNLKASNVDNIFSICSTFEEHHGVIFNILWEMVVSSNTDLKICAANLLKVLVSLICLLVHFLV